MCGDAAGLEDAIHLPEHLNGTGEVLDRHRNDNRVKGVVVVGQRRVLVDVLDNEIVQVRIVLHLHRVHAQACQPGPGVVRRPVGAPAAHQVQHHRVRGYEAAENIAHGGNGPVVNVYHQARLYVEVAVVGLVLAAKVLGWKRRKLGKRRTRGGPPWRGRGEGVLTLAAPTGVRTFRSTPELYHFWGGLNLGAGASSRRRRLVGNSRRQLIRSLAKGARLPHPHPLGPTHSKSPGTPRSCQTGPWS